MPATLNEVQNLIQQAFPGANVGGVVQSGDRIYGQIVWPGFATLDVSARNQLVTRSVRNPLGLKGMNVGILHPVAPGEQL